MPMPFFVQASSVLPISIVAAAVVVRDDGRHALHQIGEVGALPLRRSCPRSPCGVRVRIDEARRDDESADVDRALWRQVGRRRIADEDDAIAANGDIGDPRRAPVPSMIVPPRSSTSTSSVLVGMAVAPENASRANGNTRRKCIGDWISCRKSRFGGFNVRHVLPRKPLDASCARSHNARPRRLTIPNELPA